MDFNKAINYIYENQHLIKEEAELENEKAKGVINSYLLWDSQKLDKAAKVLLLSATEEFSKSRE